MTESTDQSPIEADGVVASADLSPDFAAALSPARHRRLPGAGRAHARHERAGTV